MGMDFFWNEEERDFRGRAQQFLEQYWDSTAGERVMGDDRKFERQLAEHGWLTMAWSEPYGGRDATHIEEMIFREEATLHEASTGGMGPSMIGPCLIVHGTEEQKKSTCRQSRRVSRGGVRASRNQARARTSRRCKRAPYAMTTIG
jgi:alkylation response protein AidB-like acyl-CoA dehydrogenase